MAEQHELEEIFQQDYIVSFENNLKARTRNKEVVKVLENEEIQDFNGKDKKEIEDGTKMEGEEILTKD